MRAPARAGRALSAARASLAIVVVVVVASACATGGRPGRGAPGFRISEVAGQGDPARRASTGYVLEGLTEDARTRHSRAVARYELAVKVDPTNPYAYLALARFHTASGNARAALSFVDQAEALLEAQRLASPRVRVHLRGLRGRVWYEAGRVEAGLRALAQARRGAPREWDDGRLDALELR